MSKTKPTTIRLSENLSAIVSVSTDKIWQKVDALGIECVTLSEARKTVRTRLAIAQDPTGICSFMRDMPGMAMEPLQDLQKDLEQLFGPERV